MSKELVSKKHSDVPMQLSNLIDSSGSYDIIATRSADPNEQFGELKIFDENKLAELAENMVIINEKMNSFGRGNTFHSNKLMTLQMLSKGSPFRMLRQCLSQIERKRSAINETLQSIKKKKIDAERLLFEVKNLEEDIDKAEQDNDERCATTLQFDVDYKKLELEEIISTSADSRLYLEGALKEIGSFQQAYKEICVNKNIPEDWDESNFEEAEPKYHIRHCFSNGLRDLLGSSRLSHGTSEHMIQFGINPIQGEVEIQKFIGDERGKIFSTKDTEQGKQTFISGESTFTGMDDWLVTMEEKYKDNYKEVLDSFGLENIVNTQYMYETKLIKEE